MIKLFEVYDKIAKRDTSKQKDKLAVPRAINIMQRCVDNKIQDCFITRLHFNDLYVLLLTIDINNVKQAIAQIKKAENKKRNINVREISQQEAVNFLKGG